MKLTKDENFFIKQQKEFKKMAEKAGSDMAYWKHKAIRLEEENNKLKTQLEGEKYEINKCKRKKSN